MGSTKAKVHRKICPVCCTEFYAANAFAVYDSDKCRKQGNRKKKYHKRLPCDIDVTRHSFREGGFE